MYLQAKILSLTIRTLAKDRTLSLYLEKRSFFPQRGSKDRIQTMYWKISSKHRGSNYELVVFLGCKPSANSSFQSEEDRFPILCLCAIL